MNPAHPLIQDCVSKTGLSADQVSGALGLVLTKLEEVLPPEDVQTVRTTIPDAGELMTLAPKARKGLLGKLAGSVGGDRARLLMELSRGLSGLGIPSSQHRPLADALTASVECHYPQLRPVFERITGPSSTGSEK